MDSEAYQTKDKESLDQAVSNFLSSFQEMSLLANMWNLNEYDINFFEIIDVHYQ